MAGLMDKRAGLLSFKKKVECHKGLKCLRAKCLEVTNKGLEKK
jgi:hypothetical protein